MFVQGSPSLVFLMPIEQDWVRFHSKGKSYSLIRGWRGGSSPSRAHAFVTGRGWGCSIEFLGAGRVVMGPAWPCCSPRDPSSGCRISVHSHPYCHPKSWIEVLLAVHLHTAMELGCCSGLTLRTLVWSTGCETAAHVPCEQVKLDKSTNEELRPYHLVSIWLLWGTPVGFVSENYREMNLIP